MTEGGGSRQWRRTVQWRRPRVGGGDQVSTIGKVGLGVGLLYILWRHGFNNTTENKEASAADNAQTERRSAWSLSYLSRLLGASTTEDTPMQLWHLKAKRVLSQNLAIFRFTSAGTLDAGQDNGEEGPPGEEAWQHYVFEEPNVAIVRAYSPIPCDLSFDRKDVTTAPTNALAKDRCFLIKQYADGPMSRFLHRLRPHQSLRVYGPYPTLSSQARQRLCTDYDRLILIGGGTGIAPFIKFASRAIADRSEQQQQQQMGDIHVLYATSSQEEARFVKDTLEDVQDRWHTAVQPKQMFQYSTVVGRRLVPEDIMPLLSSSKIGEEDAARKKTTPHQMQDVLPTKPKRTLVMVCGPPGMHTYLLGSDWRARSQALDTVSKVASSSVDVDSEETLPKLKKQRDDSSRLGRRAQPPSRSLFTFWKATPPLPPPPAPKEGWLQTLLTTERDDTDIFVFRDSPDLYRPPPK